MRQPDITPERYELEVVRELKSLGGELAEFSIQHRERISALDGDYQFDAVARFKAFGEAKFVVLFECKLNKRPVEREEVLALHAKLQSVGAHKAIMFSTAGFQAGAIEYAEAHGIALVHFTDGTSAWGAKSRGARPPRPSWAPEFAAWVIRSTPTGEAHSRSPGVLLELLRESNTRSGGSKN